MLRSCSHVPSTQAVGTRDDQRSTAHRFANRRVAASGAESSSPCVDGPLIAFPALMATTTNLNTSETKHSRP